MEISSLPINEQEWTVVAMRDEQFASIYASDSTMITKLDRLCRESPEYYEKIEVSKYGNRYILKDKSLISFRKKKKEMSEEQKKAASDRFKNMWKERNDE